MKAYTDIEQSKKLKDILPIESADMWFAYGIVLARNTVEEPEQVNEVFPCWSLAALLNIIPDTIVIDDVKYSPCLFPCESSYWDYKLWHNSNSSFTSPISFYESNPIDACYEMIIKLHEKKLL